MSLNEVRKSKVIDTIEKLCDGVKKLDTFSKYNQKLDNYCRVNLETLQEEEILKIMTNLVKYIKSKYPQRSYDIFKFFLKKYGIDLKSLGYDKEIFQNKKREATKMILENLYKISNTKYTRTPQTGGEDNMYVIRTNDGIETVLENDNLLVASCFFQQMTEDISEQYQPIPLKISSGDLKIILNILDKLKKHLKSIGNEDLFYDLCKKKDLQENIEYFENIVVHYNFEYFVLNGEIDVKQDIYKFMVLADYLDIEILKLLFLKVLEEKIKFLGSDELADYFNIEENKFQELKKMIGFSDQELKELTENTKTETSETGTSETGTSETETSETETSETGTSETGTSETETSETETSETETSETGTSETGTSETETSETGTSETGTSETETSETGTSETEVSVDSDD